MTENENHDPVNRWATEHYGFADEPAGARPSAAPVPLSAPSSRSRRPALIVGAGVLSLGLIAGIGGVAAASRGGQDVGRDGGRDGFATRFDGNGRADRADGDRR